MIPYLAKSSVLMTALLLLGSCAPAPASDEIDALAKSHLAERNIPGMALAVVKDGKVVLARAYGLANVETSAPVGPETVFPIQSITKQFTATAIMMLVEQGKLGLDDPIHQHLAGTPPAWNEITIRHLLTHTSGIKDFINEPNLDLTREYTEEEIFRSAIDRALNFAPGEAWAYSNTNYHLLAMIIRKASGVWYGNFLAERIFKPLGMEHTWVIKDQPDSGAVARGYVVEEKQRRPGTTLPLSIAGYGGGGIRSTVTDLAKWDAALYSEQLLTRSSLEQMWTPVRLNNGTTHGYGFGWEILTLNGHRLIWHAGGWVGYSAHICRFIDDKLTVIVLTNLRDAAPGKIARDVAAIYLPDVAERSAIPIADTEPQVTRHFTDILTRCAAGTLRAEDFTVAAWSAITPYLDQLRRDLTAFGPLQTLSLLERTEAGGNRTYLYRCRFTKTTQTFQFELTPQNRLAVFTPVPGAG